MLIILANYEPAKDYKSHKNVGYNLRLLTAVLHSEFNQTKFLKNYPLTFELFLSTPLVVLLYSKDKTDIFNKKIILEKNVSELFFRPIYAI